MPFGGPLLPTTRLHDEQMFIRSIQIFEGLYRQTATAISSATRNLLAVKPHLRRTASTGPPGRLEAIPTLFRVLTTMPIDAFSVLRGFTNGRSAVQSRAYREIRSHARPLIGAFITPPSTSTPGKITLQCVYLSTRSTLADAMHFEKSMRRLDRAWCDETGQLGDHAEDHRIRTWYRRDGRRIVLETAAKASLFPGLAEAA